MLVLTFKRSIKDVLIIDANANHFACQLKRNSNFLLEQYYDLLDVFKNKLRYFDLLLKI